MPHLSFCPGSPNCPLDAVRMSMSATDLLEARIATAYTLRDFDDDARRIGIERMVGRAARERKIITDTLRSLGGIPWPFSAKRDNSWLPR